MVAFLHVFMQLSKRNLFSFNENYTNDNLYLNYFDDFDVKKRGKMKLINLI